MTEGQATPEQRRQTLANEVAGAVARGGRIETQTDYQAVIVSGRRVNHILHLILTVLTAGLWVFVWIYLVLTGGEKREVVTVSTDGLVSRTKGKS